MVGQHHQMSGNGLEQTLGECVGQEAWQAAVHVIAKS